MSKTKRLTVREYYGSSKLSAFSVRQQILKRVNKEAEVLSEVNYMSPIPRFVPQKVNWSEAAKHAFSNTISLLTI